MRLSQRRHFIAALTVHLFAGLSLPRATWANAPARILVVGDSLSAEYGLARGSGWVALLQQRLQREGMAANVINASISGDTSAGGRSRLPALLRQHRPTHVVIELGGNDALRGLPLEATQRNLTEMVRMSRQAGARVLLVGIQVPPNYGRAYTERFAAVFEHVASTEKVPLVPFLLRGVADVPEAAKFFQPDRIHPNEAAQPVLLDNVWPALRRLLKS
ncbi:MAG: arylesterase [Caldimonas sp.]|nr:MAG: arylesterase [Caldimonas sp.]